MKKILISPENNCQNEHQTVIELFKHGLDVFHIRKPNLQKIQLCEYIDQFPKNLREKCVLHSHYDLISKFNLLGAHVKVLFEGEKFRHFSRSCHTIDEINAHAKSYSYVFLSSIFDSISKVGYTAAFSKNELNTLRYSNDNIIALGGISSKTINRVNPMVFSGFALLGAIWNQPSENLRIEEFKRIVGNYAIQ